MIPSIESPSIECCPLCGSDNECGGARGAATCWCTAVSVSEEALALVPPELRGKACLCPECALGQALSPCVHVCQHDRETSTCSGCLRTMREIGVWGRLSRDERLAVLRQLERRDPEKHPGTGRAS